MNRRTKLIAGAAALLVLGAGYYFVFGGSSRQAARTPAPAPVVVATVGQQAVPVQYTTIGTVQPISTVMVKSRVDGQIFKVGFAEGQLVHQGDLLFQLDPRPYQATLDQAQANQVRDKASLVRAQLDLKRYTELAKKDFAPQQQLEQARATAESAQATLDGDQAAVEQAKLNLDYAAIRSPLDGRTGNLMVTGGNLVKATDTAALVTINQVTPIYVSFSVPQDGMPEVQRRMASGAVPVSVTINGDTGGPIQGPVTFINNQVDSSTGTIQLKATFANEDGRLVPGQFVNVAMTLSTLAEALVIPSQAVQSGQNGTYVFVVKPDKTVEMRVVQVGPTTDTKSVITKGLELGEQVVIEGQLRLVPGAKVDIKNAA
jgi:membrane fusion protein, multidrug efflux system